MRRRCTGARLSLDAGHLGHGDHHSVTVDELLTAVNNALAGCP